MSLEEEDDFWNASDVKAFNFDDEDQSQTLDTTNNTSSTASSSNNQSSVKTLGSILAAKPSSNQPFLRPSFIACDGSRIEELIEHLDNNLPNLQVHQPEQDPKSYVRDVVDKKKAIDFSPYKSKRDKLLLLDCAICCFDGNAITAVTIFISQTLKSPLFIEEMKKRPIAVDHYLNYLEMTGRNKEATEFIEKLSIRHGRAQ